VAISFVVIGISIAKAGAKTAEVIIAAAMTPAAKDRPGA